MARTQTQIQRDLLQNAAQRGISTFTGKGSVLRELLGINAFQFSELETQQEFAETNSFLASATGLALERHATDMFLQRIRSKRSKVLSSEQNVRFYTTSGADFNTLPGGTPSLAKGTRVYSRNGVVYSVTNNPILVGANEVFVSIECLEPGALGNIKKGELDRHSLNGYEKLINVENRYNINNGFDQESDRALRARVSSQMQSLSTSNESAIRQVLSRYPEIGKSSVIFNYKGAGNVGVIIQPRLGILMTDSTLRAVEGVVQPVLGATVKATVKNPELKEFSMETTIRTSVILNTTEQSILAKRIEANVLSYMNRFQIGRGLSLNELGSVIANTDSRIISIGSSPARVDIARWEISDGLSTYEYLMSESESFISVDLDELMVLRTLTPIVINIV